MATHPTRRVRLPARLRQIAVNYFQADMTFDEIAKAMDISTTQVNHLLMEARVVRRCPVCTIILEEDETIYCQVHKAAVNGRRPGFSPLAEEPPDEPISIRDALRFGGGG